MQIERTIKETKHTIEQWKQEGNTIGFVPTMGYLHEGHKSLIDVAREENDKVVVSIFVNPTQFGPKEDLAAYPRDFDQDVLLCEKSGVDLIFYPTPEEMYPQGFCSFVDMTGLSEELCGKSRPTHFKGVQTIVAKLFHIIPANRAYFGQKDAQQLAIIKRMVKDLDFDIEIIGCPIIREADGLAKSSRNVYLSREEREQATVLYQALRLGEQAVLDGEQDAWKIKQMIINHIKTKPLARIDYVEVVEFSGIKPIEKIEGSILVAIAVYFGKTRLIDNVIML